MSTIKKISVISLILIFLSVGIFANGSKEGKEEKITLKVLNYLDLADPNSANQKEAIWDKFQNDNPDIVLEIEELYNEPFHQKVEAYVASGNIPDVLYMWPSGRSSSLHETKSVKDLRPLLEKDGLLDQYASFATANQIGGYLGELPLGMTSTHVMFVNTKVLRDLNLEIPKTYEELKAMVPVLKANGVDPIGMSNMDAWVMQSCLFSLVTGRYGGADWADRLKKGEITFEDEWFKKSLNLIKDMYDSGLINRNSLQISYGSNRGDFAQGKYAFYIDGDWACGAFQEDISTKEALFDRERQEKDLELIVIPALPEEVVSNTTSGVVGVGFGMSSKIPDGSKKEEAAWRLIKYLQGEYVQTYRLKTGISFPSNLNVDVDKVIEEEQLEPLIGKRAKYYQEYSNTTPVIDGVLNSDVYNVINIVLQEIGLGETNIDEGAAKVQKAWLSWKAKQ